MATAHYHKGSGSDSSPAADDKELGMNHSTADGGVLDASVDGALDDKEVNGTATPSAMESNEKGGAGGGAAAPGGPPGGPPVGPPPNGGLQAWAQVACAFSLFFNTWGLLNTFGVFQTYYESGELFHESSSNIAWIGAVQTFCILVVGFFSGPVYDRGYLRALVVIGSFMVVFGFMMLSLAKTFWQVVLSQGFCIGIGSGMLFVPAIAILPTYFTTKLGAAIGLAASGSSMGGIIYPIVFYRLINRIHFGWSVRVLGFIALAMLILPSIFLQQRVRPPKPRSLIDWTVFSDLPFILFVVGTICGFIGLMLMLVYISFFGLSKGITDEALSFYLIPILNAGSVFGRTVPNAIADKVGALNILLPGSIICCILTFCMLAVHNVAGLVIMALLFGFFSGVFIALPPLCLVQLSPDKSKIGTRIGMAYSVISVSVLAGGPGAGGILQNYTSYYNWTGVFIYGGVAFAVGACIFVLVRMMKAEWKIKAKV